MKKVFDPICEALEEHMSVLGHDSRIPLTIADLTKIKFFILEILVVYAYHEDDILCTDCMDGEVLKEIK